MSNYDQVFWLNVTNAVLGLVTLACVLVIGFVAIKDIRRRATSHVNEAADDHAFEVKGLGIAMADGGTKVREDEMLTVSEDGIEDSGAHHRKDAAD